MAAIDTANANLLKLQTDVTALIAAEPQPTTGGATEAQVQALADGIAAVDATVVAATPQPPAPPAPAPTPAPVAQVHTDN